MKTFDDIQQIASECDIEINGQRDSDIQVLSNECYKRLVRDGSLGFGEAYVERLWECTNLSELFYKIARTGYDEVPIPKSPRLLWYIIRHRFFNLQSLKRSKKVCQQHYNLGNKLYELMLDSELNYSCGYWRHADDLEQAQRDKLDLICRKLDLKPGMRVLDVGSGWGSFARYAAQHYGVEVVGINISTEQVNYAREHAGDLPIQFLLEDYRNLSGEQFDRIVSIGMFEHVGAKNYPTYFQKLNELLKDDGLFLLHTIVAGSTSSQPDPWIEKYIFPNSKLPSLAQITQSVEPYFCVEDLHNFGSDYDKTLMAWYHNFTKNWDKLKHQYDERFYRIWTYYLLSCAGAFRARAIHLWQAVLSKQGVTGGYASIR